MLYKMEDCGVARCGLLGVPNVMSFLQLRKLFFSPGQISLGGGCILLGRHVVEDYDIPLLQMETVQMVEGVFGLGWEVQ